MNYLKIDGKTSRKKKTKVYRFVDKSNPEKRDHKKCPMSEIYPRYRLSQILWLEDIQFFPYIIYGGVEGGSVGFNIQKYVFNSLFTHLHAPS